MANNSVYKGTGFGMVKAPDPPKNQPKANTVKGTDLRTGGGKKSK